MKVNFHEANSVITILSIGVLAIFIFGLIISQNSQLIPSKKSTPTSTPTTDWKTYRNEKYGFEIKYPEDWIISEDFISKLLPWTIVKTASAYTGPSGFNPQGFAIIEHVSGDVQNRKYIRIDILRKNKDNPHSGPLPDSSIPVFNSKFKYNVADTETTIYKHTPTYFNPDKSLRESISLTMVPYKDDIYYYVVAKSNKYTKENEKLLLDILSTFEFLEE